VNALAKPEVGKYLNTTFVSTYQKVGTFRLAGKQKQGGNVASYFCTPDGHVLHAIAGPVNGATLLREARWAVEAYKLAQLEGREDPEKFRQFFWDAHAQRLSQEYGLDLNGPESGSSSGTPTPTAPVSHLRTLTFKMNRPREGDPNRGTTGNTTGSERPFGTLNASGRPQTARNLGNQGRVHLLLTAAPVPKIEQVYKLIFEKVLNEKVSTAPVVQAR
jgi:hypothetical protein